MDTNVTVCYDGGELTVPEDDFRRHDRGLSLKVNDRTEILIPDHSVRWIRIDRMLTEVSGKRKKGAS